MRGGQRRNAAGRRRTGHGSPCRAAPAGSAWLRFLLRASGMSPSCPHERAPSTDDLIGPPDAKRPSKRRPHGPCVVTDRWLASTWIRAARLEQVIFDADRASATKEAGPARGPASVGGRREPLSPRRGDSVASTSWSGRGFVFAVASFRVVGCAVVVAGGGALAVRLVCSCHVAFRRCVGRVGVRPATHSTAQCGAVRTRARPAQIELRGTKRATVMISSSKGSQGIGAA